MSEYLSGKIEIEGADDRQLLRIARILHTTNDGAFFDHEAGSLYMQRLLMSRKDAGKVTIEWEAVDRPETTIQPGAGESSYSVPVLPPRSWSALEEVLK